MSDARPDPGAANPRIPFEMLDERVSPPAPGGKPLIVHVVVNVEHWPFDRPLPRSLLSAPHGVEPVPNVANFSWVEYGLRCGMPRLLHALGARGLTATAAINSSVIDAYPRCAERILEAGWEFMGHGEVQRSLQAEEDEAAVIERSLRRISAFTGRPVRGWLGPGLHETGRTPELLRGHGIEYVCDWVLDDLPCALHTQAGDLIAVPYSLDLNDVVVYLVERQPSEEIDRRVADTLSILEPELESAPRVLTLPLHPHVIGVPHRLRHLLRALDRLAARPDTVFMTGAEILDWYLGRT